LTREIEEERVKKGKRNRTNNTKESIMKEYFPNVEDRLKMKINLTQNLAAIQTAHGKKKAYFHL